MKPVITNRGVMSWCIYKLCFTVFLLEITLMSVAAKFSVVQKQSTGDYTINVNDDVWLYSGPTSFQANRRHHSTQDGTLKLTGTPVVGCGTDILGTWKSVTYHWNVGDAGTVQTSIQTYENFALFHQKFNSGLQHTSVGDMNSVISAFPSFERGKSSVELGALPLDGLFIGWMRLNKFGIGKWSNISSIGGMDSGPFLLFDSNGNVLIISPFTQFMASSYSLIKKYNALSWGIMGDVDDVPKGYEYTTLVYYNNQGINKAVQQWGSTLRMWYRRSTASRTLDPSINYIGYYTDNGAYYYHHTEPKVNYEKTIEMLLKYIRSRGIPYRYLQLDDWWYPIQGPGYGATITWTALPEVFPHGLQYIYNISSLPVVAHNRYWSNVTTYAKQNGGKFNFVEDGISSLPDDQNFWDYLFKQAKEWGLVVYEQDWLRYQVLYIRQVHSDLTLGRRWLTQMGEAANRYGLQIQYCMAQPRHLLASLEVPAVSQIRASLDYQLSDNQWRIGITSMFAEALGIAPFKDNFWTVTDQPGNPYNKTEPFPLLQAAVSLLSTGPVGVSDRVGYSNLSIIDKLVNSEGLLLKPSKAASVIDAQILHEALGTAGPDGEVWTTYSIIGDLFFGIIFSPQLAGEYQIGPEEAAFPVSDYAVYSLKFNCKTETPQAFSKSQPLTLRGCVLQDFCLYYTTPVLTWRHKPLMILGELSKLVPISPQRVSSIQHGSDEFTVELTGGIHEKFDFVVNYNSENMIFHCLIGNSGSATLSMTEGNCHGF